MGLQNSLPGRQHRASMALDVPDKQVVDSLPVPCFRTLYVDHTTQQPLPFTAQNPPQWLVVHQTHDHNSLRYEGYTLRKSLIPQGRGGRGVPQSIFSFKMAQWLSGSIIQESRGCMAQQSVT